MDLKGLFGFENKNVVITGAGSGMGKAAARLLAELGANVYATVRSKPLDFEVAKEIKTDFSRPEAAMEVADQVPSEIKALFICHGISDKPGRTNALEVQLTNFFSFKCLTEVLKPRIADNGSVSFISSNGGKEWRAHIPECEAVLACSSWEEALSWYGAHPESTGRGYVFAKECQNYYVMSRAYTPEFTDRRLRLNAIAPGFTITGLSDDFNKSINGDAQFGKNVLENLYLGSWNGRAAAPEEMGHPLVALGSKICSYVSGQVIYIDYGNASAWEVQSLKENSD